MTLHSGLKREESPTGECRAMLEESQVPPGSSGRKGWKREVAWQGDLSPAICTCRRTWPPKALRVSRQERRVALNSGEEKNHQILTRSLRSWSLLSPKNLFKIPHWFGNFLIIMPWVWFPEGKSRSPYPRKPWVVSWGEIPISWIT